MWSYLIFGVLKILFKNFKFKIRGFNSKKIKFKIVLGGINMVEVNEVNIIEQMIYSINNFKDEMVKAMNFIREDVNDLRTNMNDLRTEVKDLRIELKGEINDLRQELRDYKEENNKRWEQNEKRWEENNKRWEENNERWNENNKRWEENNERWNENNKRWEENNKRWIKYEDNRKDDRKFLLDTLTQYDVAISKQIGDPNADKMRKLV